MLAIFTNAIHDKQKVRITFRSSDGRVLVRYCAPMDYGPSRSASDNIERYHCWDYGRKAGGHVLSLLPDQVISIDERLRILTHRNLLLGM